MIGRFTLGVAAAALALCAPAVAFSQAPTRPTPQAAAEPEYKTSLDEYNALKARAHGGRPAAASLPDWRGVWVREGRVPFPTDPALLTPKYRADFERELAQLDKGIEWDRLSDCLPTGMPRWLSEPWNREFITTPDESWLIHEQLNEIRRVYTDGRGHVSPDEAPPGWLGDSIGFWDGDTLVIHTNRIKAGWYQRRAPAYSFQVSTVERWRKISPDMIEVKATIYDPPSLLKPWHTTAHYKKLADPKARVEYNACEENNNVFRRADGGTDARILGEPGYRDSDSFGIPSVAMDTLPK